jgi:NitT/TauT family transport system substrate-binding protein
MVYRNRRTRLILVIVSCALLLMAAACGGDGGGSETGGEDGGGQEVRLVLGWLAEPSRGGFFAAQQQGYYEDAGFEVFMDPGTRISAIQVVAAGRADFGLGDADELLTAREQGIPLVAVATSFQRSPRILVFHEDSPVESFEDLNGRVVYVDLGDDWWEFVKEKYNLDQVEERAYTGQLANFVADPEAVVQGYLGSENVNLEEKGVDVGYLYVGDSGFDPYTNTLFTTEGYIEENPDTVEAFVEASIRGWEYYEENYEEVNRFMQQYNQELTVKSMNANARVQQEPVYGFDAEENGVGYMSEDRWTTLQDQLLELGVMEEPVDVESVFTNEFLP